MDERMNGSIDRWKEGRMNDGWNGRHVRLDGRLKGPMDGWKDE